MNIILGHMVQVVLKEINDANSKMFCKGVGCCIAEFLLGSRTKGTYVYLRNKCDADPREMFGKFHIC